MKQPASRQGLIDYALRQLEAPMLEINVAEEQLEDLLDDALQFFHERHFDGVSQVFLKYQITSQDISRGKAKPPSVTSGQSVGITSTTVTESGTDYIFYENSNYIPLPPSIIGINKIFQYDDAHSMSMSNMFSFKYQLFLNEIGYFGSFELLQFAMSMTYLETMNFLLNTHKAIRFNQRQDRLYIDVDFGNINEGDFIIIDCWKTVDGNDYAGVWNDSFLKEIFHSIGEETMGTKSYQVPGCQIARWY